MSGKTVCTPLICFVYVQYVQPSFFSFKEELCRRRERREQVHLVRDRYMKDILKGSALIFGFKVLGAVSLLAVNLFIARYYGALTLGAFNIVQAILSCGTIFSRLGLDMYVVRMIPVLEVDAKNTAGFLQKVFKMTAVSSGAMMLLLLVFLKPINIYLFKSVDASRYIFILAMMLWPYTLFNVMPEMFRGFQDIKIYSFFRNISQNLFMVVALFSSTFIFSRRIDPIFTLYYVSLFITILMVVVFFLFLKKKNINILHKQEYDNHILKYSYPMLFTSSMIFMMGNIDSFMISYYLNEAQVGYYTVCLKLSLLITFFLTSVNNYILPKVSKYYQDNKSSELINLYKSSVKLILICTMPVIILIFLFPTFFLGIFGEEFKVAKNVLYVVMSMNVVSVFIGPVINVLNMIDLQNYVKNIMFLGLLLNVVANYILIPKFGIIGAATGTLLSTLVWKILAYVKLKKQIRILEGQAGD